MEHKVTFYMALSFCFMKARAVIARTNSHLGL